VQASFEPLEARMLATFAGQVIELLHDDAAPVGPGAQSGADPLEALLSLDGPVTAPDDPVLARLLPDAYRGDDQAASDFRRYTESTLRAEKVDNARTLLSTLGAGGYDSDSEDSGVEVELQPAQVQAWLRCLTDMRLALATRLGIEDDEDSWDELAEDDPRAVMHDVYGWLGYVQETLVQALD